MSVNFQSSSIKSGTSAKASSLGTADVSGSRIIIPTTYGGLGIRFFEQLSTDADKILQVDTINNITETRGSVKTRAVRLAIEMTERGVAKNDIILISSKTHAHQTIVLVAALFLGAIVCPISPESPSKECRELVKKLKPKMAFCDGRTVSQIDKVLTTLEITCEIVCFGNEMLGVTQFCKLFPLKEEPDFQPIFIDNPHKEVAFIVPTQGTCADPKLVCLSHHNIYFQCLHFMEICGDPTKVVSFFPLSWLTQTILACSSLEFGMTTIMATSFNERSACKMIHDFRIDCAILGTELALRLCGNVAVNDFNLDCLKCVLVGIVSTTKEDFAFMRQVLPKVKFLQIYSLTETGFITAVSSLNYVEALEKSNSVGKLLKNCKVKILDAETKQPVGADNVGELYYYGDGLMLGYFKDTAATIAQIDKRYFRTGDLACYDADGWLYLEGRIDDVFALEGQPFIPTKLEHCIVAHPQIHDAAVIGNQTELVLCVQKKPESKVNYDNLMMYLFRKMPEFNNLISKIVFMDELPRTSVGNIKKRLLRDQFLQVKLEYTTSLASITPTSCSADDAISKPVV
ncbi:unnamed protein product [Ceutorhynchus assimilis]|uniref:Uncharacterized protein n=1 Tax=Ceutorhynchus assimilis TaxID=467358 RepID=A0A9N9QS73_9CUCU|nr:unnamed protein product [Ceutorhynchus assimilis]